MTARPCAASKFVSGSTLGGHVTTRSIAEKIRDFLCDRAGRAYCDDCVQERLGLKWRQQVQMITSTLAVTEWFVRTTDACSTCKQEKLVIRANQPALSRLERPRSPLLTPGTIALPLTDEPKA